MSNREITRLEVMQRLKDKRLRQNEASRMLGISVRQVRRLFRAFKDQGPPSLISKRRGKPSHNQLDPETVQKAIDLICEHYCDFGPTLAHEKLIEKHDLRLSRESVRGIMIAEGWWKPKRAKKPSVHQMRERRACFGELVQIDGSDHDWFEGRTPRCTLLVYIDDATGQLGELWFVPEETFFGYCEASRHYFKRYGKPVAFYSDKHGIFRVNQPRPLGTTSGLTQFGRAMQELDVEIICANTPQAKGRIERANLTLQDRLVKELRLARYFRHRQRQCIPARVLPGLQPPFCRSTTQQPRCPSSLTQKRKSRPHLDPSKDRYTFQEPYRAVQRGDLPDPVQPPRLCHAQRTGHRV